MNSSDDQLKVGLFGIGLEAYWEQFAGLRDRLVGFTDQVSGTRCDDPGAWAESFDWVEAARVAHAMEHDRLGVMGHYYGGMLDIYSDLTQQCSCFGGHIEILEVEELADLRSDVSEADA